MKRRKRMVIFFAFTIIMLSYFPNSLIADNSQDEWGVKEGDEFTFFNRYDIENPERSNTDCGGPVKIKITNISATGILTFNMTSNIECSNDTISPRLVGLNYTNKAVTGSLYGYVLSLLELNLQPEKWNIQIEDRIRNIESWILEGTFNGTYSSNIDPLGYSFIVEGLYLDPISIDGQIKTYRSEISARYKPNGVAQKWIAAHIFGNYTEEMSTVLVESNLPGIPGIPTNFLIGIVGLSVLGMIFNIHKKNKNTLS